MSTTRSALWPSQDEFTLLAALRQANWPIWVGGGAIELLGLKPSTLIYRVKVFGIRKNGMSELIIKAQRY